jgi:protein SCO1/2
MGESGDLHRQDTRPYAQHQPATTMTTMRPPRRPHLALLAATLILPLGVGCATDDDQASDVSAGPASGAPTDGSLSGAVMDPPLDVAGVTLPEVTAGVDSAPFRFVAPDGELLAVYFGYLSCPDVCPTTMADLSLALEEIGDDADRVSVAMVSVDPERDTPELIDSYLGHFFDQYHSIVTDDLTAQHAAQDAFLASSTIEEHEPGEPYEVSHTANVAIVDDQGRVVVQWPFGLSPELMASDMRILLADT